MAVNLVQSSDQALIYTLSEELSGLIIREHQILQDELNQVSALVGDAVKVLGTNIRELNAHVAHQEKIHGSDSVEITQHSGGEYTKLSKQVNSNTSNMTRALQFDDIVQQLAGHASDRISQMQELFHLLDRKLSEIKVSDSSDEKHKQLHSNLQVMIENVIRYRLLLEKANPVKQDSMSEGKIELF